MNNSAAAPVEITARRIVWGRFMNAGRARVAPDFLLVDRRIRDGLVEALRDALRQFYGDDTQRSADDARIIHGGQRDPSDLYLAPTILTELPVNAPVMQEEILGPILPVLEFDTLDDALALPRGQPTPLALYLFTNDRAVRARMLDAGRSGGVWFNDPVVHLAAENLPIGDAGESGMGAYRSKASLGSFSHHRSVLHRSFGFDAKLRYPPPRVWLVVLRGVCRFLLGG